jgi:serine/threonine protein phosphatase PrpC
MLLDEDKWKYEVHVMDHQGRRTSMEDRIIFLPFLNEMLRLDSKYPRIAFLAIYDGMTFGVIKLTF